MSINYGTSIAHYLLRELLCEFHKVPACNALSNEQLVFVIFGDQIFFL